MDALIDTNVLLNFITGRVDPHKDASEKVVELASDGMFLGFVAFHSLSTLWYVLHRWKSEEEARFWLKRICELFTVAAASHAQVVNAAQNETFRDFEDCLQDECAQAVNAQYIVTCNIKDFQSAKTKAVTPEQFLRILNQKK